ncbi:MAG TPA: SLOG family protein [Mycobacterium sp.]|nr:SLOG family protein [Mycobacterium sp.]
MTAYRVLVTGSREWRDRDRVETSLRAVLDRWGGPARAMVVVHGAARGADRLADGAAKALGCQVEPYPVPSWAWRPQYAGKGAGHARNALMVRLSAAGCVAFPLGLSAGTRGCMALAADAGIRVWNRGDPALADGLYRVTRGTLCAGFEVRRGVVVACAPVLRRGLASWWRLAMGPASDVVRLAVA